MFYLSLVVLILTLLMSLHLVLGMRQILWLRDWQVLVDQQDSISVIVPARNEQQHIESAMRSLLRIEYPNLQVVAVNDRSTDGTGEILDRLAAEFPQLQVVHIQQLPSGWLGKNHALHQAAQMATGTWLLFADADVTFHPHTLHKAMSYATHFDLDHLAVTPGIVAPSASLKLFVLSFITLFCAYFKPWKARQPGSKQYVGIGAFNLLKRSTYQAIGGHEPIRMRPDDDMMLGKAVKRRGFKQDVAHGVGLIEVPWYGSLPEAIVGLEKNAFSGVNYRIDIVVLGAAALLATHVAPFVAGLVTTGWTQVMFLVTSFLLWAVALRTARWMKISAWIALCYPLGVLLILFVQWRAMILTYINDGIRWRDTHYSLKELKSNQI